MNYLRRLLDDAHATPPLYRWKSFWLGVWVLVSIGWAWRDSTQASSSLSWGKYMLSHAGSGLCIKYFGPRSTAAVYPMLTFRFPVALGIDVAWQKNTFEAPAMFRGNGITGRLFIDPPGTHLDANLEPRNAAERHFYEMIWNNSPGSLAIFIPHWLLILLFLVPWTAFLGWRWRRMRGAE